MRSFAPGAIVAAFSFLAAAAGAHPSLEERIARESRALAAHPDDVPSLLRRGELLGLGGAFGAAEDDYARALTLDPSSADAYLGRAELHLAMGRLEDAQRDVEESLRLRPASARAWRTSGRILAGAGALGEACTALDRAISLEARPRPDDYQERAELSERRGNLAEAIAVLDRGFARLAAPALAWRALELAADHGDVAGALARLDSLARVMPPSARVAAKRGDLLAAAGRRLEAMAEWTSALEALESAPRAEDRALAERLRAALADGNP